MILIVSPHFDDAVFSVGDYMAAADDDVVVVTVFGGSPRHRGFLSDWDRECGFTTSHEAMQERRAENRRALAILDAEPIDLWFAEYAYEQDRAGLSGAVQRTVEHLISYLCPDVLLVPLGLAHPDHELTFVACASLPAPQFGIYADIPYSTVRPLSESEWEVPPGEPHMGPTTPSVEKHRAVREYRSQLTLVERMGSVLSQERIWWAT